MFVGHYSASFAAKAADPRLRLGPLFLAAQLVDILWASFILTGVEHMRLVPGYTATNQLDLYDMPYTHSLAGAAVWALLAVIVWGAARNWLGWRGSALLIGAVVLSHWFLDLPVHTPDLPLYDSQHKMGFGLWNYEYVTLALEGGLLLGSVALYYRATHAVRRGHRWGMLVFALIMVGAQAGMLFAPQPETPAQFALMALAAYAVLAILAEWLDRKRA